MDSYPLLLLKWKKKVSSQNSYLFKTKWLYHTIYKNILYGYMPYGQRERNNKACYFSTGIKSELYFIFYTMHIINCQLLDIHTSDKLRLTVKYFSSIKYIVYKMFVNFCQFLLYIKPICISYDFLSWSQKNKGQKK